MLAFTGHKVAGYRNDRSQIDLISPGAPHSVQRGWSEQATVYGHDQHIKEHSF